MGKFKIRASKAKSITTRTGITDKQASQIKELKGKKKELSEKQQETLDKLIAKRDNPDLPKGAITYCEDWVKEELYGVTKSYSGKYTEKGNLVEDDSIDFVAEQLGYGMLIKNEEFFSDKEFQGTPDVILKDIIIDVKNSWSHTTFPLFDTKIPDMAYYWQAQVYMALVDRDNYKLIYTLMDTPEHLVADEFEYDNPNELPWKEFLKGYQYSHLDPDKRIKVFDIERNHADIKFLRGRVKQCRDYIDELLIKLN